MDLEKLDLKKYALRPALARAAVHEGRAPRDRVRSRRDVFWAARDLQKRRDKR